MLYTYNTDYKIIILLIIAILYVSVLYVIGGIILTYFLDRFIFNSDNIITEEKYLSEMSLHYILFTTILIVGCISVFSFIGRMVIEEIPFPLNGIHDFKYMEVREVTSGGILTIIMFAFSKAIFRKYKQIKYKLNVN